VVFRFYPRELEGTILKLSFEITVTWQEYWTQKARKRYLTDPLGRISIATVSFFTCDPLRVEYKKIFRLAICYKYSTQRVG
jgi:hypothetical protein